MDSFISVRIFGQNILSRVSSRNSFSRPPFSYKCSEQFLNVILNVINFHIFLYLNCFSIAGTFQWQFSRNLRCYKIVCGRLTMKFTLYMVRSFDWPIWAQFELLNLRCMNLSSWYVSTHLADQSFLSVVLDNPFYKVSSKWDYPM